MRQFCNALVTLHIEVVVSYQNVASRSRLLEVAGTPHTVATWFLHGLKQTGRL